MSGPVNVRLSDDGKAVIIVDQSALPGELRYLRLETLDEMYEAVKTLRVRGAPAIGVFAGFALCALSAGMDKDADFKNRFLEAAERLSSSRPTAVNLSWACRRMTEACSRAICSGSEIDAALLAECTSIYEEDVFMCSAISSYGLSLLKPGMGVLTHCNAGPLATSRYGTALGPLILAAEKGIPIRVYADETRPLLQGARLTAYELMEAGVDVTLICDDMASWVMSRGLVDACFVGCDTVALNGDTANKIGTSAVAILAKHYGIPFYVLGPTSTIDPSCRTGSDIRIEMRPWEEITSLYYSRPVAPEGVKCLNPSFDVTEASLISGIITQHGIALPPFEESLPALIKK
ncbi:MAG: S-methyl-5-thioribose-1-phosphate isomerase [Oscillospiraceae bacterium]|nr:S-methyl-5-thioribose-1-phosphate isomerase [Oscillospiraceae bacterium]